MSVPGIVRTTIQHRMWAGLYREFWFTRMWNRLRGGPVYAGPRTMEELAEKQKELGNEILEVDLKGKRLLVSQSDRQEVWGCKFCLDRGLLVIAATEQDLYKHCEEQHGWKNPEN